MVKFGRINHLTHPLCETLLRQKWLSYGFPIHILNLSFYILFLSLLSYFIITFPACNHHDSENSTIPEQFCSKNPFISFKKSATTLQIICIWYSVLYCFLNFILEIIQFTQDGCEYFQDIENYIQWILYITTSVFTLPFLFDQSWHYQWVAGSISIFTAYLAFLFLLGRFDIYGIYVIMFLEIMKTLLHVLSLFSILIFGFALTFCVLRPFTQVNLEKFKKTRKRQRIEIDELSVLDIIKSEVDSVYLLASKYRLITLTFFNYRKGIAGISP